MTYAQFLGRILLPALVLVGVLLWWRLRSIPDRERRVAMGVLSLLAALPLLAVVFTTPWDSWLIANGVWWYDEGSVTGTVFGVPYEEYAFMAGQTLLTIMWTVAVVDWPRARGRNYVLRQEKRQWYGTAWVAASVCGAVLAATVPSLLYPGAIVAWFGIPLAVQAFAGADVLAELRRDRLRGLALTPLLWVADAVAIDAGAWHISTDATTGLGLFGLPVEEAAFFLCTNLLVVNSVLLAANPVMRARMPRAGVRTASSTEAGRGEQGHAT